ncbi:uncharacterized protein LOC117473307 [Trematomus bernacchii]|uniref:uncharacterized protein LOC117473307 n=1 Tax=Trematomus bernacchii TaxID=40690 RepID=UPI00146E000F|nr:uncharacterized protein LOC117473307 [Trematomus bernacchii]
MKMDMPLIRKWWCLLLMERFETQGHGQRFAFWTLEARSLLEGTLQPVFRVPRQSARMDISQEKVAIGILQLPEGIIRRILTFVVLEDGDPAICTLALTCESFKYIMSQGSFQKEAHFNWLDSVVNWNIFTEGHKQEFRKAYQISRCSQCDHLYKDVGTGYRGSGRRGILQGFYSEEGFPGYCTVLARVHAGSAGGKEREILLGSPG